MIAVSDLSKSFGPQLLFAGASFQLNPENRYGLVGANGSGKSTLLKIMAGDESASSGTLSVPKKLRLGVLKQDHFEYEDVPILNVVLMGNAELWAAMSEKEELLANADESFDSDRYAELEDTVLRYDGYTVESKAGEILEGLGIPTESHDQPLSTLSGGFKLRVLLAQVLAADPEVLLLDEPTNHLDIVSIRWLEIFLQNFKGSAVVISHDHRFLDNVCTHILDVDYETVTLYIGNYSDFEKSKVADRDRREAEIEKREKEIAHHQDFVTRFRAKASKARQAQSKMRLIEKKAEGLERLAESSRRYPKFKFVQRRPTGRDVLTLENIGKSFDDNKVLENVSLTVRRNDRLAILGPNGIGKSTLLKIAMDKLEADSGTVEWGHETYPGYFAQDHKSAFDNGRQSVEAWLWDCCPAESVGFVRGNLAMVLFTKDEVEKRLESLSGGEAARLIFCRLSVEKPNILVLDEPTNHLDIEAIEALIQGLQAYDGTLIFVSHDRWFVSRLATRILEITPDGINDYDGSYDEYLEHCDDDHLDADSVVLKARRDKRKAKAARKGEPSGSPAQVNKKKLRALEKRREEITSTIETHEARVNEINESFCDPTFFDKTPREKVRKLENEQKTLASKVEELMSEWETVESELTEMQPK